MSKLQLITKVMRHCKLVHNNLMGDNKGTSYVLYIPRHASLMPTTLKSLACFTQVVMHPMHELQ